MTGLKISSAAREPFMHVVLHVTGTVDKDEEVPPPLPQRTPESYILAADAGWSSVRTRNISETSQLFVRHRFLQFCNHKKQ